MATIVIKNLPEKTYSALRQRALSRGISLEAEIQSILVEAVPPEARIGKKEFVSVAEALAMPEGDWLDESFEFDPPRLKIEPRIPDLS